MKVITCEEIPEEDQIYWLEGLRERGEAYMIGVIKEKNPEVGDIVMIGGQALVLRKQVSLEVIIKRYGRGAVPPIPGLTFEVTTD